MSELVRSWTAQKVAKRLVIDLVRGCSVLKQLGPAVCHFLAAAAPPPLSLPVVGRLECYYYATRIKQRFGILDRTDWAVELGHATEGGNDLSPFWTFIYV